MKLIRILNETIVGQGTVPLHPVQYQSQNIVHQILHQLQNKDDRCFLNALCSNGLCNFVSVLYCPVRPSSVLLPSKLGGQGSCLGWTSTQGLKIIEQKGLLLY